MSDAPRIDENFLLSQQPVVLEFMLPTCPPCQELDPKIREVADAEKVPVVQVNAETFGKLCDIAKVEETPTVVIIKDGMEVKRLEAPTKEELTQAIRDAKESR